MKKLALLLSLMALGALGLVACGGDDDDPTTAASEAETTRDELAADNKSCGALFPAHDGPHFRLAVVEGDISCRGARRVMHDWAYDRLPGSWSPGSWSCLGPEADVVCTKIPASSTMGASSRIAIRANFSPVTVEADARHNNRLSSEERIEQNGNKWAALFAAGRAACRYMGQPACERMTCERVATGPIENCKPPPPEFRESFANATVERVVVSEDHHRATAEFSNGESAEFEGQRVDGGDIKSWGHWAYFITERWVKNAGQE